MAFDNTGARWLSDFSRMNLTSQYDALWESARMGFLNGVVEVDHSIDSTSDTRYGMTLIMRPSEDVRRMVEEIVGKLMALEPDQYAYPASDVHLTVLSLLSCSPGFTIDSIPIEEYIKINEEACKNLPPIRIHFRGLTASPAGILIQGFPENETLNMLRDRLRSAFKSSRLRQTIDIRYTLQTAHMTVMRFRKPLRDASEFVESITKRRNVDFGRCEISDLTLVGNNWYMQKQSIQELHTVRLGEPA
jgi:2'-5' RNA ligase